MPDATWIDVGSASELSTRPLRRIAVGQRELALSFKDGMFGVVSNTCNHVGGPLGDGRLDGDYIVCPWHNWKFHRCTGEGEPGFEEDRGSRLRGEGRERPRPGRPGCRRRSAPASRTTRIRCRARSNAPPARCGSPAFRPPRWTKPTRASPAPTICSVTRLRQPPDTARKPV